MGNYVKTPVVYQMEAAECGAASLSMILAFYGRHLPLEQLRIDTGVSRDGCNAGNILRAARKYGLECHGFRRDADGLRKLRMPCILYWEFNHFVVLEGFRGKYVYINDPAAGRCRLTAKELEKGFTGVVLTFEPTAAFKREKSGSSAAEFVQNRFSGQSGLLGKLAPAGVLLSLAGLVFPVVCRILIDRFVADGRTEGFGLLILLSAAALAAQILLTAFRDRLLMRLEKRVRLLSARDFLYRLFRLPLVFYEQRYPGDLTVRTERNTEVNLFVTGGLAGAALELLSALFCLGLLFWYSPLLTLIAASLLTADALLVRLISGGLAGRSALLRQEYGKLAGTLYAGIRLTETLKAAGAEEEYAGHLLQLKERIDAQEQRLRQNRRRMELIPEAAVLLSYLAILTAGGILVMRVRLTVGMLAAFLMLFSAFSVSAGRVTAYAGRIRTARSEIECAQDIMQFESDPKYGPHITRETPDQKLEGEVTLRAVSFGYRRLKPPILTQLSLQIPCGTSMALVGASGSGKSTAARIVSGLYEPWSGELLFDGIPAREIPGEVQNASISTVSQEVRLFSGSIRDNLTMWNDNISDRALEEAAKDACIHEVIASLPGGYEYRLSEGGTSLSLGQRQRLEIARALATGPTILILDEATSSLDPVVEKRIMDNIRRRGCTCLVIAQRLSTVRDCDRIAVLEKGRIVQEGTHGELRLAAGPYRELMHDD